MYARARFTVEKHDNALVVPTLAVVDLQGKIGVWVPADEGDTPVFNPVTIGIEQQDFTEITSGVKEGQRIITTGAAALRPGDRIVMAGQRGGGGRAGGGGTRRRRRRRRARRERESGTAAWQIAGLSRSASR